MRKARLLDSMTAEERQTVKSPLEEKKLEIECENWTQAYYGTSLAILLPTAMESAALYELEQQSRAVSTRLEDPLFRTMGELERQEMERRLEISMESVRLREVQKILVENSSCKLKKLRNLFQKNHFMFTPEFLGKLPVDLETRISMEITDLTIGDVFRSMVAFHQVPLQRILALVSENAMGIEARAIAEQGRELARLEQGIEGQEQEIVEQQQTLAMQQQTLQWHIQGLTLQLFEEQEIVVRAQHISEFAQAVIEQRQRITQRRQVVAEQGQEIAKLRKLIPQKERALMGQSQRILMEQTELLSAIKDIVIFPTMPVLREVFATIAATLLKNGTVTPFLGLLGAFPLKFHRRLLEAAIFEAKRDGDWTIVREMVVSHFNRIPEDDYVSIRHKLRRNPAAPADIVLPPERHPPFSF